MYEWRIPKPLHLSIDSHLIWEDGANRGWGGARHLRHVSNFQYLFPRRFSFFFSLSSLQTLNNQFILFLYMFEMRIHKLLNASGWMGAKGCRTKENNSFRLRWSQVARFFFNFTVLSSSNIEFFPSEEPSPSAPYRLLEGEKGEKPAREIQIDFYHRIVSLSRALLLDKSTFAC